MMLLTILATCCIAFLFGALAGKWLTERYVLEKAERGFRLPLCGKLYVVTEYIPPKPFVREQKEFIYGNCPIHGKYVEGPAFGGMYQATCPLCNAEEEGTLANGSDKSIHR